MIPYQKIDGQVLRSAREYDIATSTEIKAGQVVALSEGLVVAAAANITTQIIGIAAENHPASSTDGLNPRSDGKKILVYDDPALVFQSPVPVVAATGGSATTMTASTLAAFSNDDFNGGYIKLIEKADGSTNTDPIGKIDRITDYAYNSTGTVSTFTKASGGTPYAGDKYEIYPPIGFKKGNLDSTSRAKLVLTATASLPIKVVGKDIDRGLVNMMALLHTLGTED